MCHFISWIEYKDEVYFLDDTKLNTKEGKELLKAEYKDDLLGHGAIRHYYPELKGMGRDCECTDFSSPKNFPDEIVGAIKKGLFRGFSVCVDILTKSAWAEYQKIEQLAYAEYKKIEQLAWAEYKKIEQLAYAEYQKIQRPAFWDLAKQKKNRKRNWK